MRVMAALTVLVLALCGCKGEKLSVPETPAGSDAAASPVISDTKKVDVGDVEANVELELTLEPGSAAGVTVEELKNAKQKLNSVILTVPAPKPAELWVKIFFKTNEDYPTRPVAVRGKLFRQIGKDSKEEIFQFNTIFDGFTSPRHRVADGTYHPMEFRVDVIKGLAELPPTMSISAIAELVMSPTDTDPATIDPATYTSTPEDEGHILSNSFRINYTGVPAPAPVPEAAAPAVPASADPSGAPVAPDAALVVPDVAPAPAEAPAAAPAEVPAAAAPVEAPPAAQVNPAAATEAVGAAQ